MPRNMRITWGLAVWSACVAIVAGQEPASPPKARVEFRWLEDKQIEGLTEEKGIQTTCDPRSICYPHKKPALVVTAAEVAEVLLTTHDFSKSGSPGALYMVTLHLTKAARDKLAKSCASDETQTLTVVVDGKFWGAYRYERDKDRPLIAPAARAESFTPSIGFFSSRAEAERLVNAVNTVK